MAVVGSANLVRTEGMHDAENERRYTSVYRVQTDSRTDLASVALTASGLPTRYSSYGTDGGAFLKSLTATNQDPESSLKVWTVTAVFSRTASDRDDPSQTDDPLLKPVQWSGSFVQSQEAADKDKDGQAIVNTAGEGFDPPAMRDVSYPTIVAIKNYSSLNLDFWGEYADAVNSDTFLGLGPRKVRIRSIEWDERFRGNQTPYYEVRFTFLIRNIDKTVNGKTWVGHDYALLSQGFHEIDPAGGLGDIRHIKHQGVDVTSPQLLGATGSALARPIDQAAVAYTTWRVYPEKPFAALGLPGTTDK